MNIDGGRIGRGSDDVSGWATTGSEESENRSMSGKNYSRLPKPDNAGRWPANVILDEEAGAMLDGQTGITKGGASRFFYCAKSSKRERGEGNNHPTVKPISLLTYLAKLVCPPGGVILDPFMGSGSMGVAAEKTGFHFLGIEKEKAYYDIAVGRVIEQDGNNGR